MVIKDSKIIVTGGAGFIGSFIVDQLIEEGAGEIIVVDNLVRGREDNLEGALKSGKVKFINGDIRDTGLLDDIFRGINFCFHMAALRITNCAENPKDALTVMADGTYNVAEVCIKHGVKKVIAASSASIYGQADTFPTDEKHHPYNNITLYGAMKMSNELMFRALYHMSKLDYVAMRYFNVYGPRMDVFGRYTEVLIKWYHLIRENKQPIIYGEGKQTMDFVYVEDIARANILALKSDVCDEVFNVASGVETSLEELCSLLLDVMGSKLQPQYINMPDKRKKVEVVKRLADTGKAVNLISFKAKTNLKEGLTKLVEWLDACKLDEARTV